MKYFFYLAFILVLIGLSNLSYAEANASLTKEDKDKVVNRSSNDRKAFYANYTSINNDTNYTRNLYYIYYRKTNLLRPLLDPRINIKKDNFTIFFLPSTTEFSSENIMTGGIKYYFHKGIELYYHIYQKPGTPIGLGIINNIGLSFSKQLFK